MTDQFSLFGAGEAADPPELTSGDGRSSVPPPAVPVPQLPPPPPAPHEALTRRLRALGLPRDCPVIVHTNRTVLLRFRPDRGLRIHLGYGHAPDEVLQAIVKWARSGLSRRAREALQARFMDFPVHLHVPPPPPRPRRPPPTRFGDHILLERLSEMHHRLNAARFDGALRSIPIQLSSLMRTRLGELRAERGSGRATEIVISRLHLRQHGWEAVERTLLHEMVHQWQAESGRPLDHGAEFRRKAREVGIVPRARARIEELVSCGTGTGT